MRTSFARLIAVVGVALIVGAMAANQSWLDRHFLPSFFVPRHWYVWIETTVRIAIGIAGVLLIVVRARVTPQVVVAGLLAIGAGAAAISWIDLRPTEWLAPNEEPRRQEDAQLGWVLVPGRTGHASVGGRSIDYAIDAAGERVRRRDEPVDRERPTIVFGGESVMFGEGLTWDESIPSQAGTLLAVQTANLAVHGYGTDQIYMRLARELPHFKQPLAVVAIFMTELFGRNLDDDRPHLGPGLQWVAAQHASRVMALAGLLVPYRREPTIDQGIEMTRDALRAIAQLARQRGTRALVVIPQFGAEDAVQHTLRDRIFTPDIPTLVVHLAPDWRLPWDRHPNARAARVIAETIATRLHQ